MNIQTFLSALSKVQFKNDKALLFFASLLVIATGVALKTHYLTGKEAGSFLLGALALPGLFGRKDDSSNGDSSSGSGGGDAKKLIAISGGGGAGGSDQPKRSAFLQIIAASIAFVLFSLVAACSGSSITKADVRNAEDTTQTALTDIQETCIAVNAIFQVKLIEQVCGVVGPAIPVAERVLNSLKASGAASPRAVPVTCEKDGSGRILCVKPYAFPDAFPDAGAGAGAGQ